MLLKWLVFHLYVIYYKRDIFQQINKRIGFFTKEDEEAFEMFAIYCGLALHHAKLYDKIRRSEQKYRVALEVLSYHNTSTEDDLKQCLSKGIPTDIEDIDSYYFSPFKVPDADKVLHTIYMFTDLFGLQRFDQNALVKFTLTVKKNYRKVPYHNWSHGFSVANSIYAVLKSTKTIFRPNEVGLDFYKLKSTILIFHILVFGSLYRVIMSRFGSSWEK